MDSTLNNKVAIFDLGNVVLDWNVSQILKSLNLEPEEENLLREELFSHQVWLDLDHGRETEASAVIKVCERSVLERSAVEKAIFAAKDSLSPISETISLMQDLSNNSIEMYCLSNMPRETYDHIKNFELFKLFNGIIISGIEGCSKPNDDIFHLIIRRFELEPRNTLFIDDSLPNINAAERLGINGFHFKRSDSCYANIRKLLL